VIPLFERYPELRRGLPHVSLCQLPTPVHRLDNLGRELGLDQLYVKRDDLSGEFYGGNKVRKLEFLLGRALRDGKREVMTFGFAGSNHALATAVYARQMGLRSISMLMPQPNASYVRRNLLMSHYYGAELHQQRNARLLAVAAVCELARHRLKRGASPQVIPPGGSSPLGTLGFVNAAFELRSQVEHGELPEPDRIYVPLGTAGTSVGLMLGLKAAGFGARVVPVRVVGREFMSARRMVGLFDEANSLLHSLCPSFPVCRLDAEDVGIEDAFLGGGYAQFTQEGMAAVERMRETEGISLEGTYTGKALAALGNAADRGGLRGLVVLFWNTVNSRGFPPSVAGIDYRELPPRFHRYFEEDVQALDKGSQVGA